MCAISAIRVRRPGASGAAKVVPYLAAIDITEEDAERLRATGPIRELINFVSEVANPIGIPGPI
jgi:hypothetical protein